MSAYDNRVKSSQEKLHHHLHHHHHLQQISRQRKWRIFISVGLLVPALAAIIGLVAWSISVEFTGANRGSLANGEDATSGSSHLHRNYRSHHQQQQQQPNHLQKQSAQQEHRQQPLYRQFRRQSQQPQQQDSPASGAERVEQPRQPVAARLFAGAPAKELHQQPPEPSARPSQSELTSIPTSGESEGTQGKPATRKSKKTISESIIGYSANTKKTRQQDDERENLSHSSAALQTKRKQLAEEAAHSGSPSPTREEPPPVVIEIKPNSADGVEASGRQFAADKPDDLLDTSPKRDTAVVAEEDEEGDGESARGITTTGSSPASRQKASEDESDQEEAKSVFPKSSRWRAGGKLANTKKAALNSADSYDHLKEAQAKSPKTKALKYTIFRAPSEASEPTSKPARADEEAEPEVEAKEEGEASEGRFRAEELPVVAEERQEEASEEARAGNKLSSPEDEQVSFEAIASAISTTLSAEQGPPASETAAATEQSAALANDEASSPLESETGSQTGSSRRSRTTGEHVAEVIDHIVSRRKEAQPVARSGPHIVVVAPVAGSELMKARSLVKEQGEPVESKRPAKLRGARLLGSLGDAVLPTGGQEAQAIKYSERVQVIENDDSTALLMKASEGDLQQQEAKLERKEPSLERRDAAGEEQASSIHLASHSSEARLRTPRHGLPPALAFERYAPVFAGPLPVPVRAGRNVFAARTSEENSASEQPKLYSAEQLIREHVMRSKLLRNKPAAQSSSQPLAAPEKAPSVMQPQPSSNFTSAGLISGGQEAKAREAPPETKEVRQMKVLPTTAKPAPPAASTAEPKRPMELPGQARQQPPPFQRPAELNFAPTSGMQSVQVPLLIHYGPAGFPARNQLRSADNYPLASELEPSLVRAAPVAPPQAQFSQEAQFAQETASQQQAAQQEPQQLPLFADQEYNVPAHMADTVIQDIQRSPSTINVVNGQPTLISSAGQVPQASSQAFPNELSSAASQAGQQQQQVAWNPHMAASSQRQQMMLAAARQMAALNHQQQQLFHLQHQHQQQQQQQQQQLANRNSLEAGKREGAPVVPARRGLGHPIAQFALRRLFQSLGQQAAEQEAQHQQLQSRSMAAGGSQRVASAEPPMQTLAGSTPAGSQLLPPQGFAADQEPAGRQMRSLAGQASQQQLLVADQEVQESAGYGAHMQPAYHMQPQQQYESADDKKSKGITFHFGGGPIGGGTQLITSPMGIFKHLMIPLLPNPRVNLNGKVVFGVVLEKTTAFGEPKKKYKLWG